MSESDKTDRNKGKSKSKNKKKSSCSWALRVFLLAVALSALLSFFSSTALEGTGYAVAIIVLAVFIALGIVFDMIGVAVTAADPKPYFFYFPINSCAIDFIILGACKKI